MEYNAEMMDEAILRMVDANGNRAREALRVMEDYARFVLNDGEISGRIKRLRHGLAGALAEIGGGNEILMRDTAGDVGTEIKTESEGTRETIGSVVIAAGKRLSEALRVIEEVGKIGNPAAARIVEELRYEGYELEKVLARFAGNEGPRERFAKVRLCVLLTEKLCHAASGGWEKVLEAIVGSGKAGEVCVQLREKELGDGELLRRAKIVAKRCAEAGMVSIINDRADVAVMAGGEGADGVHVGQSDLPCAEARKLVGMMKIVGVSTGRLEEARAAVRDGATYVAAGPMFCTTTKEKPVIAGVGYAGELVREVRVPVVAIGGITAGNVREVVAAGVKCVAVCAGVIGQPDVRGACEQLLTELRNTRDA